MFDILGIELFLKGLTDYIRSIVEPMGLFSWKQKEAMTNDRIIEFLSSSTTS